MFLWQIAAYYNTVWSYVVCILTEKRKKAVNNLTERKKYGSINSPRCPSLWFVYILMPGKEEWVLIFPDYLSVSGDYVQKQNLSCQYDKILERWFLFLIKNKLI